MSTASSRSYAHKRLRAALAPWVAMGIVHCWRCNRLIEKGEPFDLGHDDLDPTKWRGAECRKCNRATAGRAKHYTASRKW